MLEFPSELKQLDKVENFVDDLVYNYDICPDVHGNILISLTEAVNNAIKHGNKEDASKKVFIKSYRNNSGLSITVQDEGDGFDFDYIPDPTSPDNILCPSGRGVYLMQKLCDNLVFLDNGAQIEMQFNL